MNRARSTPAATDAPIAFGGMLAGSPIWKNYRDRFIERDGRVVDTANGGASHSEGQGYGMLLAVAAADRDAFDLLWRWSQDHLLTRRDRLAAWNWDPRAPDKNDRNNATDGDILIAWALAEAADLWTEPSYLEQSRAIVRDIGQSTIRNDATFGPILLPGASGFSSADRADGPVINLSYWVFPAFARLARVAPDIDWSGLARAGTQLIAKARFGKEQTPTDWISINNGVLAPANGFPPTLGYNSIRIPLYLFWSGEDVANLVRPTIGAWRDSNHNLRLIDARDNAESETTSEHGYRSIAALTACADARTPYPRNFYSVTPSENYYPTTLHILSIIAAVSRGGPCLDGVEAARIVNRDWITAHAPRVAASPVRATLAAFPSDAGVVAQPVVAQPIVKTAVLDAPFAAPRSNDDTNGWPLSSLWTAILSALAVGCVALIARWRRKTAASRLAATYLQVEKATAITVAENASASESRQEIVPRHLQTNIFDGDHIGNNIERKIEIAAEASARLGRRAGVIYLNIPGYAEIEKLHGKDVAGQAMEAVAAEMRARLRASDQVALLGGDEIVVCICLLSNLTDLKKLAIRTNTIIRQLGLADTTPSIAEAGVSMHPIDGYSGEELIASAKLRYLAAQNPIDATPLPKPIRQLTISARAEPEKPATPRKKPVSPRKSRAGKSIKQERIAPAMK